jgi:cholesterol transport system auxiliary component
MTSFMPNRRRVLLAAPCLMLSACSNIIGPPPASQIYVLLPPSSRQEDGDKVGLSLAIAKPDAPDSLSNDRIALARSGIELDYYANAIWADDLPDLVQTQLLEGFEATGRIEKVGREENGLHADYKLLADIRNFEARYTAPNALPTVTVAVVAYMMRTRSREMVSTINVTASRPCAVNSVGAVVEALDLAMAEVTARVVSWALALTSPSNAGP